MALVPLGGQLVVVLLGKSRMYRSLSLTRCTVLPADGADRRYLGCRPGFHACCRHTQGVVSIGTIRSDPGPFFLKKKKNGGTFDSFLLPNSILFFSYYVCLAH